MQQYAAEQQTAQQQAPAAPPADDLIGRLERLAELKKQGILTDAEFEAQKAKILADRSGRTAAGNRAVEKSTAVGPAHAPTTVPCRASYCGSMAH
ncbi:SHOCT domain-containing protein [Streptomyces sp. NBC_01224]|uniref:SHOCT domain-containing protein n=1 Tax=unclassified Streptomyces TaxID=2593676 RepID=UPI002E12CCB2|nr:SHOCT domain-containing protein [Streptomyces sp. NBC_01224]